MSTPVSRFGRFCRVLLFVLFQCTWGLPQTLVGFFLFLLCKLRGRPSFFVGGAVCTEWKRGDGISLGLFFFCPSWGRLHLHEYGHTFQSALSGLWHVGHTLRTCVLQMGHTTKSRAMEAPHCGQMP